MNVNGVQTCDRAIFVTLSLNVRCSCKDTVQVHMLTTHFFFFSSRRRHTILRRDWSSDVCSSDLWTSKTTFVRSRISRKRESFFMTFPPCWPMPIDRKSDVQGKSVDIGGRRIIKKKKIILIILPPINICHLPRRSPLPSER